MRSISTGFTGLALLAACAGSAPPPAEPAEVARRDPPVEAAAPGAALSGVLDGWMHPSAERPREPLTDVYLVTLEAGDALALTLTTRSVDGSLTLEDPSGARVGAGAFDGARVPVHADCVASSPGRYRITVHDGGGDARYRLRYLVTPGPGTRTSPRALVPEQSDPSHVRFAAEAGAIVRTLDEEGSLAPGDPDLRPPGSGAGPGDYPYYDDHQLEVRAGDTIDVVLTSEAFDASLAVFDPAGTRLAAYDDEPALGGHGTDSHLTLRIARTETIAIRTFSYGNGRTGVYHLRVALFRPTR